MVGMRIGIIVRGLGRIVRWRRILLLILSRLVAGVYARCGCWFRRINWFLGRHARSVSVGIRGVGWRRGRV